MVLNIRKASKPMSTWAVQTTPHNKVGCNFLFEYASGIVNCGCHNPGETGCPNCIQGATTCNPLNIPERVEANKKALCALMNWTR